LWLLSDKKVQSSFKFLFKKMQPLAYAAHLLGLKQGWLTASCLRFSLFKPFGAQMM
jgi:hypothetical protein